MKRINLSAVVFVVACVGVLGSAVCVADAQQSEPAEPTKAVGTKVGRGTEFHAPPPAGLLAPQAEPLVDRGLAEAEIPQANVLRERAQARWDAVVKMDFDAAYGYEVPAYREKYTAQQYADEFGRRVRWNLATVQELRYDRQNEADVVIALDYSVSLPGSSTPVRTTTALKDHWVFLDGQWWRRDIRVPLGRGAQSGSVQSGMPQSESDSSQSKSSQQ